MQPIGLLIEFKDGLIKDANLGLATMVRGQNRPVAALVVDDRVDDAKTTLEGVGIGQIIHVSTGSRAWGPARRADAVVAAMREYSITSLVGLTSPAGRELLPRIAARLDAPLIMDCIDIDLDNHRVQTSQYSGKTMAGIALTGRHFIYGMRANVVTPLREPVTADLIEFSFQADRDTTYELIETRSEDSGAGYLAEADIIISGGRGLKNGENFKLLDDCAKQIGASVGASRVAVDNGWVPYAMQVGQTGIKVNPKVYLAVGISGSVQHFAGMKTARTIIAINSDPNAAIMANCDYYAVADLFDILPALKKALIAVTNRND